MIRSSLLILPEKAHGIKESRGLTKNENRKFKEETKVYVVVTYFELHGGLLFILNEVFRHVVHLRYRVSSAMYVGRPEVCSRMTPVFLKYSRSRFTQLFKNLISMGESHLHPNPMYTVISRRVHNSLEFQMFPIQLYNDDIYNSIVLVSVFPLIPAYSASQLCTRKCEQRRPKQSSLLIQSRRMYKKYLKD
jgi:hypothetical protein